MLIVYHQIDFCVIQSQNATSASNQPASSQRSASGPPAINEQPASNQTTSTSVIWQSPHRMTEQLHINAPRSSEEPAMSQQLLSDQLAIN